MDKFQKIELILILLILFVNLFFLIFLKNPAIVSGLFFYESINNNYNMRAPHDFVNPEDIEVYPEKIVINIKNYTISKYKDSGSMIPVLGEGANGVGITPKSEKDIHIGDIITFKQGNSFIVHRVIEEGIDDYGIFFITKGDNNDFDDGKIRFSQIESVLVAIIY